MYTDLSVEAQIRLAAEFLARGVPIPRELNDELGPEIMSDLLRPEKTYAKAEP